MKGSAWDWGVLIGVVVVLNGCASHFQKAEEAYGQGKFDAAHAEYSAAITAGAPETADAYFRRGVCKLRADETLEAKADYREAVRLKPDLASRPDYADFYYTKALAYAQKEDDARAASAYADAIEYQPDFSKKTELGEV